MSDEAELTLFPLLGFATHTLPKDLLMLTVEIPVDSEKPEGERQYLRLALRAIGARKLAESLIRAADATEMGQAPTQTKS